MNIVMKLVSDVPDSKSMHMYMLLDILSLLWYVYYTAVHGVVLGQANNLCMIFLLFERLHTKFTKYY